MGPGWHGVFGRNSKDFLGIDDHILYVLEL
jgi:hypothetical protein